MKKTELLKKTATVILAFSLALIASVAVYATVTYNSATDPVVSLSGLAQYVENNVLSPLNTKISELNSRLSALESSGGGGGGGGGLSSEAYKALIEKINALEKSEKENESTIKQLQNDLINARNELEARIGTVEQNYSALSLQFKTMSDMLAGISNNVELLKKGSSSLEKDFASLSDKYLAFTKNLTEIKDTIERIGGQNGEVTNLKAQLSRLEENYKQLQSKAGVMYRPVFVESGKIIKAKNEDEGILVILRSGYAEIVSPFNTSGTLQGINDLSNGDELYNGAEAPMLHNLLIPRGGDDGRGIHIISYDGAYVMIGGEYVIVDAAD